MSIYKYIFVYMSQIQIFHFLDVFKSPPSHFPHTSFLSWNCAPVSLRILLDVFMHLQDGTFTFSFTLRGTHLALFTWQSTLEMPPRRHIRDLLMFNNLWGFPCVTALGCTGSVPRGETFGPSSVFAVPRCAAEGNLALASLPRGMSVHAGESSRRSRIGSQKMLCVFSQIWTDGPPCRLFWLDAQSGTPCLNPPEQGGWLDGENIQVGGCKWTPPSLGEAWWKHGIGAAKETSDSGQQNSAVFSSPGESIRRPGLREKWETEVTGEPHPWCVRTWGRRRGDARHGFGPPSSLLIQEGARESKSF